MVCVSYVKIYIQIAFLSFQFVSEEMHRGMPCLKYERKIKKFNKSNTYSFYISKTKPHRPLRYEMVGYDDMLTSHYDRYILDYVTFEPWKFNRSLFNLPKSRFSSKRDAWSLSFNYLTLVCPFIGLVSGQGCYVSDKKPNHFSSIQIMS